MKKSLIILVFLLISLSAFTNAACVLNVSLINQDPYPAIPGDSVKVVFQITGVSNPECGDVDFEVNEKFPFTVDPESANPIKITSGTYSRKYSSYYLAPYKLRIDKDSLEGDMPLEVLYSSSSSPIKKISEFNISVENTLADFEIYVKDYNSKTRSFSLEILNIEDVDVQALAIEIPNQDYITIKGANRKVVGDLDSNEYTSIDFEAIPKEGDININIFYTDPASNRREITKTIHFSPEYFTDLNRDKVSQPYWLYLTIIAVIAFFIWRHFDKKRKKKLHQESHRK